MPPGLNPSKADPWGLDSFQIWPNFVILIWGQGWYLTYHYWPTAFNSHVFEGTLYFVPAKTPRERVAHEMSATAFKEFGLQDANTLEATQSMLESRAVTRFPLMRPGGAVPASAQGGDRVGQRLPAGEGRSQHLMADSMLPSQFADLEPFAPKWCLPTERERFAERMATSMADIQAFYDAILPRAEEAIAYCDQFPLGDLPDDVLNLMHLLYSMIMVSYPVECWGQPHIPDTGSVYLDLVSEPVP